MVTFDAIIMPLPDINTKSALKSKLSILSAIASFAAVSLGGAIVLTEVTQLEHDKGNVLTAHRVDGGYALTQRGGNKDDRMFLRLFLRGPDRFLTKQYLDFLANNKSIPLAVITRETIFGKAQIESLKTIVTIDRRETIVLHIIIRQLRSLDGLAGVIGNFFSGLIPWLADKNKLFGVENVYADDSTLNGGGNSYVVQLIKTTVDNLGA